MQKTPYIVCYSIQEACSERIHRYRRLAVIRQRQRLVQAARCFGDTQHMCEFRDSQPGR